MKNTIKNTVYAAAGLSLMALNSANAAMSVDGRTIDSRLKGTDNDAVTVIQNWVATISNLLYIIAVIVILWAGFQILTSVGDEEKTKKGKTIIIQAIVGLLVIFIASSIVNFVITSLLAGA